MVSHIVNLIESSFSWCRLLLRLSWQWSTDATNQMEGFHSEGSCVTNRLSARIHWAKSQGSAEARSPGWTGDKAALLTVQKWTTVAATAATSYVVLGLSYSSGDGGCVNFPLAFLLRQLVASIVCIYFSSWHPTYFVTWSWCLFSTRMYPWDLEQCLAHGRYLRNIWRLEKMGWTWQIPSWSLDTLAIAVSSLLLLCNCPRFLWLKPTNIHYLSYRGLRIWEWLSWVALAQGFSEGCRPDVGKGCSYLMAWLGCRDLLPRFTHLAAGGKP